MNDVKVALRLLPIFRGLYEHGVIDIVPEYEPEHEYIQLTEQKFRSLFPDVEPDDKGYLNTDVDGVRVFAIVREAL